MEGNIELVPETISAVGKVVDVVQMPHIQAMIVGEVLFYAVAAAFVALTIGALAFGLPHAGQALRRNFPRLGRILKIHPASHPKSAFHVPAE